MTTLTQDENNKIIDVIEDTQNKVINVTEEDNQILTTHCNICFGKFSETNMKYTLECNHIICVNCIQNLINNTQCTMACPFCRETSNVDLCNFIEKITDQNEMVNFLKKITYTTRQKELCNNCNNIYSEYGCHDCGAKYCEKCWIDFHKFGKLKTHKKINLVYFNDNPICETHNYYIDFICTDKCHTVDSKNNNLMCILCERSSEHKGHTNELIIDEAPKYKLNVAEIKKDLGDSIEYSCGFMSYLNQFTQQTADNYIDKITLEIKEHYDSIRRQINEMEHDMMFKAVQLIQCQMMEITNQKKKLCEYSVKCINVQQKLDHLLNCSDYSLLLHYDEIMKEYIPIRDIVAKSVNFNKTDFPPLKIKRCDRVIHDIDLDKK